MAAPLYTHSPARIAALTGNCGAVSFVAKRHTAGAEMADARDMIARAGGRRR